MAGACSSLNTVVVWLREHRSVRAYGALGTTYCILASVRMGSVVWLWRGSRNFGVNFSVGMFLFDRYASGREVRQIRRFVLETKGSSGFFQGMIFLCVSQLS